MNKTVIWGVCAEERPTDLAGGRGRYESRGYGDLGV